MGKCKSEGADKVSIVADLEHLLCFGRAREAPPVPASIHSRNQNAQGKHAIYTITSAPPAGSRGPRSSVSRGSSPLDLHYVLTYLKLDLGLSNVLLAAVSAGDLLGLSDLVSYSLTTRQFQCLRPIIQVLPTSALKSSKA